MRVQLSLFSLPLRGLPPHQKLVVSFFDPKSNAKKKLQFTAIKRNMLLAAPIKKHGYSITHLICKALVPNTLALSYFVM